MVPFCKLRSLPHCIWFAMRAAYSIAMRERGDTTVNVIVRLAMYATILLLVFSNVMAPLLLGDSLAWLVMVLLGFSSLLPASEAVRLSLLLRDLRSS